MFLPGTPFRRVIGGFFALLFLSIASWAQDLKAPIPTDPDVVTGKLENGLTYYIRTNKKPANKVELRLVVKAGSILETNEQQGLAHFLEHMNFNGTKNFQKNELVSYLQSIGVQFGADLNAYTSFDQTVYILPIPTDKPGNLEKGFQIIEDWAHNALLTDKDIDDERGVVLEESRLGKGADDRMLKKYFPKLVEGSLYAERLPIGKDEILKTFKYEAIRSFYRDWYRPDLQAVVVVGDIDVATAKSMITKHFAGLANPANARPRTYVDIAPRKTADAMVVTDKEATNSMLMLSFPYVKKGDEKTIGDYRANMVRQLGIQILNRRFSDLAQSSKPPFPYAGIDFNDMVHGYENLTVYALFMAGGLEKALGAIADEVVRTRKYGFTESELEIAKKDALAGMERAYNERKTTDSKDFVEEYIRAFLDNEPYPGIENEYNYAKTMLPGIKAEEVSIAIRQYLLDNNTFTLVTGPDKAELKMPSDKDLLAMTAKALSKDVAKTEQKAVATSLITKKPQPGTTVSQVAEDGFNATTYTLGNGIKVTVKPTDFKSDEILVRGTKKGGTNKYGVLERSNYHFLTELIPAMGVGAFTPSDLEKALAGKTAKVDLRLNEYSSGISGAGSVKDFETLMQLIYLHLIQPRKDAELFAAYKDKQKSMLQFITANPRVAFFDTTIKALYGNNPRAPMVFPKAADYDKIDLDRAMAIYNAEFSTSGGYHFFITGNVDTKTALPIIETYLGSLPTVATTADYRDNGLRPVGGKQLSIKKGKEKQSMIFGVFSGQMPYTEDMEMAMAALGEVLNIRVIEEMREKMGAIYGGGFSGQLTREPYEHYTIQLQLPCGPENVDKLLEATDKEIKAILAQGPNQKDVDKVKSQWREKYITDSKENSYWNNKMERVLIWGRSKDRVLNYEKYLNVLSADDIRKAALMGLTDTAKFISVLNPEQ
ncbi:MAG: insulinase family protein [Flavipsychrobacter sp.]|nr:insulinase family protein [Flavipsychrobacter sp.]